MSLKVTFSDRDEILGALVRALAVQAGGFQMASGMNGDYLKKNGFYRFPFSKTQTDRFRTLIKNYLSPQFQDLLQIT